MKPSPRKSPYIVWTDLMEVPKVSVEAYGAIQACVIVQAKIAEMSHRTEEMKVYRVENVETGHMYRVSGGLSVSAVTS